MAAIQALSTVRGLKQLRLLGTGLGDAGVSAFADCLRDGQGFSSLEEISISACSLGLEGGLGLLLSVLKEGPGVGGRLRVIECGANPACQEEGLPPLVMALQEARPGILVHWNAAAGDDAGGGGDEQ